MRYTVIWVASAEQALADIQMSTPGRAAFRPVIVFFEVSEADRIARILQVNHQ